MKFLVFIIFVIVIGITPVFADSSLTPGSNILENTELHAQSAIIKLDIKFDSDQYQPLLSKTIVKPQLESIFFSFYGDEVILSEPELRVVSDGNHFRISSLSDGIIIYGHKNTDIGNYKINVLIVTDNGFSKFPVSTDSHLEDDKIINTVKEPKEELYIPELIISSSHDFKTYWKDSFDIDVQAYDAKINPSAKGFEGRLDGVKINVIVSLEEEILTTLQGITNNGEWIGEHYIIENITSPGEYIVDILATLDNQIISKSSSMFIIGTVIEGRSNNHMPIAIARDDDDNTKLIGDKVILDGSGSSDPDGDELTFSWEFDTVPTGNESELKNSDTVTPNFTPVIAGDYIIQLTVTDSKGKSSIDTVKIIIS